MVSDHNGIKLEINDRNRYGGGKLQNIWKLNNPLLNNPQVKEQIRREIRNCYEVNKNENTTNKNVCDTAKVVIRGKLKALKFLYEK